MEKDRKTAIALGITAGAIALGIAISAVACANTINKNNSETAAPIIGTPHIITTSLEEPDSSASEEEIISSEDSEDIISSEEGNTEISSESSEDPQPEEPADPEPQPEDPVEPEPEIPEEPEEPEEPEVITPSIDPNIVYNFYTIKDLLMNNPELNNSYCTMQVRVAGTALGAPGYCFFQDLTDAPIERGSQINQARMAGLLVREDVGNNNTSYNRGDIITISGVVAYEKVTYLGVTLVAIK